MTTHRHLRGALRLPPTGGRAPYSADPTLDRFRLLATVLYELFTTTVLYPYNAATTRDDVLQMRSGADRFDFDPATAAATGSAANVVTESNCKITEFAAIYADSSAAPIAHA